MVRLACISLPRIDLQILALRHAELKTLPAAVVTEEKPLGRITQVNRAARAVGVQPGMRFASALSICPQLRAGVVQPEERVSLREELVRRLRTFTPEVEVGDSDNALFWVNAGGLDRLYSSLGQWANSLQEALQEMGLVCNIAVGFTRFGTYAAAKSRRAVTFFENADQEEASGLRSPVGVLPLDHDTLLRLHQLGLYTIKDFVRFSPGALRRRFGREVEQLQRFARGESTMPIQWETEEEGLRREMRFLYPESSSDALLHHQITLLRELIA
ncbi:MAG: DNA polymerase Y family protein, partial [Spirochaetales bacterium]